MGIPLILLAAKGAAVTKGKVAVAVVAKAANASKLKTAVTAAGSKIRKPPAAIPKKGAGKLSTAASAAASIGGTAGSAAFRGSLFAGKKMIGIVVAIFTFLLMILVSS